MASPAQERSSLNPWVWIALSVIVSANVFGALYLFKDQLFGTEEGLQQTHGTSLSVSQPKETPSNIGSLPASAVPQPLTVRDGIAAAPLSDQVPVVQARPQIPQKYQVANSGVNQAVSPVSQQSTLSQPQVIRGNRAHQTASNHPTLEVGNIQFDYAEEDIIRPKAAVNPVVAATDASSRTIQSEFEQYQATAKDPKYDVVNFSTQKAQETPNLRSQLLEGIEAPEVIRPDSGKIITTQVNQYSQQQAERLPKIKELSLAQQSNVPPIHFSGHLYSSRSESRSIRLGQNKYVEGDWITDVLQLTAVTEDGVVFDLQGTRFYMSSFDDWNGLE